MPALVPGTKYNSIGSPLTTLPQSGAPSGSPLCSTVLLIDPVAAEFWMRMIGCRFQMRWENTAVEAASD